MTIEFRVGIINSGTTPGWPLYLTCVDHKDALETQKSWANFNKPATAWIERRTISAWEPVT